MEIHIRRSHNNSEILEVEYTYMVEYLWEKVLDFLFLHSSLRFVGRRPVDDAEPHEVVQCGAGVAQPALVRPPEPGAAAAQAAARHHHHPTAASSASARVHRQPRLAVLVLGVEQLVQQVGGRLRGGRLAPAVVPGAATAVPAAAGAVKVAAATELLFWQLHLAKATKRKKVELAKKDRDHCCYPHHWELFPKTLFFCSSSFAFFSSIFFHWQWP